MTRFRARWDDDDELLASAVPALRAVSHSAPSRPRWGRLYGALIAVSGFGVIAHLLIQQPVLRHVSDAGCALALITALGGWVHMNRVALTRVDEPDAGVGKARVRIVRSRPRASDDERVLLYGIESRVPIMDAKSRHPWVRAAWPAYGGAASLVGAATIVTLLIVPYVALANVIMVYLVGVLVAATRFGRGPSLLASVLSVAAFNFFFVPPYFTFAVADTQYLITFAVMFIVALIISDLAARIRAQAESARKRERRTAALYAMSRDFGRARGVADVLAASARHVAEVFASEVTFLLPAADGALALPAGTAAGFDPDASDRSVARRVFEHRQPAGLGATSARALYLPLVASRGALGVLGVRPPDAHAFDAPDQLHQLETFANQTALALERAQLADEAHEAELRVEAERLRNSLLSSVSHDLRTPLATITGAASILLGRDSPVDDDTRRELLESVRDEAERLNRLVQNLLEMTRLESGALPLHRDWHPVEEIVGAALRRLGKPLSGRPVDVRLALDLPLVLMDDVLVEQVLTNLLDNALKYTPAGTPIRIVATASEGRITVEVADHGPGLRPGDEERVFEKFYRGAGTSQRGAGLGLAICKAIVEAHGGRVWAHTLPEGGVAFFFTLPMTEAPPVIVASTYG